MSIQKLREERTAKAKEYRNILDANPGKLTEEESKKLDELTVDIDALQDRIDREEKILSIEADKLTEEQIAERVASVSGGKIDASGLLNKWMCGGDRALTAEDWQHINNTMSTTTDSQGGYTVETDVASKVLDALKAFGGMRNVATVIRTAQGNPMSWPTSDGTSETGEILAQNTEAADADVSFGTKSLPVYKYSSKVVTVPIELLQDTTIDMEAFVNGRIAQRLGRITNTHFTVGTGSSQPTGIIAGASVGVTGATGQITTVILDNLTDLIHSVDPAYRDSPSCKWMMSDTLLREIKQLKETDSGRPLWMPDVSKGDPATLLGYGYQINQDVAVPAANAKSLAFGDFSKYVIRDVMSITYYRFTDSAFAKKGQVGFLAFMRSGGNYMDVGGAVKVFQHGAAS